MGATLTYALFTLVGIASEDDLDAPDLPAPTQKASEPERPQGTGNGRLNGDYHSPAQRPAPRRDYRAPSSPAQPMLSAEASAEIRDRLLAEVSALGSGDDAALWAHRCLPEKNRLTAADAQRVEQAFRARLASLVTCTAEPAQAPPAGNEPTPEKQDPVAKRSKKPTRSKLIDKMVDKSVLALPEPRRVRDRDHVKYVAQQACLVCGRQPSDAHHLPFAQSRALGCKVSDEFTVPLCRGHHREVHRYGDEAAWWRSAGIDPTVTARSLWLKTHSRATPDQLGGEDTTSVATPDADQGMVKREPSTRRRGRNYKTSPINGASP